MLDFKMKNISIVFIALFLSIILSLLESQLFYLFLLFIGILILFKTSKDIIIILIIILQITFTGDNLLTFRPIVTGVSFIFLFYLFFTEYGFNLKKYPKIPNLIFYLVSFISITILFSSVFSTDPKLSLLALMRFFIFFAFCYLIYAQIKNITSVKFLILSLFLSVLIVGLTMFFEFAQKGFSFFVENGALQRLAGVYENPNYVGILLILTIPISLSYLFLDKGNKYRLLIILALLFQIVILLLADSRSSFFSVTISTIVLLFFSSKKVKLAFISVVSVFALILLLFTDINVLIELYLRTDRIGTRSLAWSTGVDIILNNIWIGTGANTYENIFYSYSPSELIVWIKAISNGPVTLVSPHPHNLFIYFWAENGILGLLIIVLFFITVFYMVIKLLRKSALQSSANRPIVVAILGILFGVFARSFFEISGVLTYGFITRDLPLWIVLIILTYFYQNLESDKTKVK